jgi:hypothetical protein
MDVLVALPSDFPIEELLQVGSYLQRENVLVPDIFDPDGDFYSFGHYLNLEALGINAILLPDRNVVSRMAQAAKGEPLDGHGRLAAALLAFAQCSEILIEPSIAFHEMAFNEGNAAAYDELSWFREADNGNPREWIAAGLGEVDRIATVGTPTRTDGSDLAKPLKRWRRNYVVALKMGELELDRRLNAMQKVTALLRWMREEFILAGPAAILAFLYFAPNSAPRKGLLKSLRSGDRHAALAGVRNAAWDITYLSDFVQRVNESALAKPQSPRHIFATFDRRLGDLARFLIGEHEGLSEAAGLAKTFERWWPPKEAQRVSELWASCWGRTRPSEWWEQYKDRPDYVGELIAAGEAVLLEWRPSS